MTSHADFAAARNSVLAEIPSDGGIGTLSEKMMHKILKLYIEPDADNHEVAYLGSVADVKNDDGIFEIQSSNFSYLIPKLRKFLTSDKVTVIYPIVGSKTVLWIDKESGEITAPRKTTRQGRATDVYYVASAISDFIPHENLTLRVIIMSAEEYKYLDGYGQSRKKRATKIDRIPTGIEQEISLHTVDDYASLLPPLPDIFTAKDFSSALRLRGRRASYSLSFLRRIGVIIQTGKRGRAYLYTLKK